MFIGLDGLKMINDEFGHNVGDEVLQDVAKSIQTTLRNNDLCGRLSGDIFIVVTIGIQTEKDLNTFTAKMLQKIDDTKTEAAQNRSCAASIGVVSTLPKIETTTKALLQEADLVMDSVKQHGRDNFVIKTIDS
jgi:diguanylate cyclase (GGDEF)-like protein